MSRVSRTGILSAAGGGVLAYVLSYVFTHLLVIDQLQNSGTWQLVQSAGDGGQGWKMVGWVFYNAHFADTTITIDTGIPFIGGTEVVNFITELGLPTLLYVIPPALLLAAGVFAATVAETTDLRDALLVGASVALGYFPLAVAGTFLFRITVESSFAGPTAATALGLVGIVYPLAFGAIGAVLGSQVVARSQRSGAPA